MKITFALDMSALKVGERGKTTNSKEEFSRNNKKLLWMLEALVKCNVLYLESHPMTPKLYASRVRYKQESASEDWRDIPTILKDGIGDCEDLASWRVAELRMQGVAAKCYLRWYINAGNGITLYHVIVRLPDGSLEDPSKKLGMKGRA